MNRLRYAIAPLLALAAAPVYADAGADQIFSFSGFGTAGVVHSTLHTADFTSSIFKPTGTGFSRNWSPDVDSDLGGQITANLSSQWSAVVQGIAEQSYNNSYEPTLQWANVKYQPNADLSFRIGRVVLPAFLFSETRNVGYTYPWVRPPIEVYALNPVITNDGVDASYRLRWGDLTDTVLLNYGQSDSPLPYNNIARGRESMSFANTVEYGSFTLLFTIEHVRLQFRSLNGLFDAFRQFGAQGEAIADLYGSDNKQFNSQLLGINYDPGQYFLIGEWCHSNAHSFLGDLLAWYLSGGYRVGKFTPYATYSRVTAAGNTNSGLDTTGLPPQAAGAAYGLNAALTGILETMPVQDTVSAGVRWDFAKNFDLKAQIDRTRLGGNSSGTLINVQPDFALRSHFTLLSATVDFIF